MSGALVAAYEQSLAQLRATGQQDGPQYGAIAQALNLELSRPSSEPFVPPNSPPWVVGGIAGGGGVAGPPSGLPAPGTAPPAAPAPAAPTPAPARPAPAPAPGRTVVGPPGSESVDTTSGGLLRGPAGGIDLNIGWEDLTRAIQAGSFRAPADGTNALAAMLASYDAMGEQFGFAPGGEWSNVGTFLRNMLGGLKDAVLEAGGGGVAPADSIALAQPGLVIGAALSANSGFGRKVNSAIGDLNPGHLLGELGHGMIELNRGFEDKLVEILDTGAPDDLEAAQDRALRALAAALLFGLGAHGIATTLELLHPLKNLGLNQIAAVVTEFSAFHPIARGQWDKLIDAAIARPLTALHNKQFPTLDPHLIDVIDVGKRHEYQADERVNDSGLRAGFAEDLSRLGYPLKWIDRFYRYQWTEPRLYDLVRILDAGTPLDPPSSDMLAQLQHYEIDQADPNWWLQLKIKRAGFEDADVPRLVDALLKRVTRGERDAVAAQWKDAYRRGYEDEPALRARLEALQKPAVGIDMLIEDAQLERQKALHDNMLTELERSYVADQITLDDYRAGVAAFVIDPTVVTSLETVAQMKHDRATRTLTGKTATAAVAATQRELIAAYRQQYTDGLIDGPTLASSLAAAGLTDALVSAVVLRESEKAKGRSALASTRAAEREATRVQTAMREAYETQFAGELIDQEGLRQALLSIGIPEQLAAAFVARAWAALVKHRNERAATEAKVKQRQLEAAARAAERVQEAELNAERRAQLSAAVADARERFRAGEIEAAQLQAALVGAGVPAPRAELLTDAELSIAVRQDNRAQASAAQQDARRLEQAYIDHQRALIRAGAITPAQLQAALELAGISPLLAQEIADAEATKQGAAYVNQGELDARLEQQRTVAAILTRVRAELQKGLIDPADAQRQLELSGVTRVRALEIVGAVTAAKGVQYVPTLALSTRGPAAAVA